MSESTIAVAGAGFTSADSNVAGSRVAHAAAAAIGQFLVLHMVPGVRE